MAKGATGATTVTPGRTPVWTRPAPAGPPPAPRSGPGAGAGSDRADHVAGVGVQRGVLLVVHEVDAEVVGADLAQLRQPVQVPFRRPEQAEPVHDVVGNELRGRVACLAVVRVVVAL